MNKRDSRIMRAITLAFVIIAGLAFVATLYGVSFSNLLFLPLAGRLRGQSRQQQQCLELIMEAACSLADGEGPRLLEQRLSAYIKEEPKRR